jgi:hypothetical protein
MRDAVDRLDPATRARAVAFLVDQLPYHLHARFLAALVALSMGDYARAGAVHGPVAALGRQLLLRGGFATDQNVSDLAWDDLILDATRQRFRAARS